jgi:uncharacterized Zn finger protein
VNDYSLFPGSGKVARTHPPKSCIFVSDVGLIRAGISRRIDLRSKDASPRRGTRLVPPRPGLLHRGPGPFPGRAGGGRRFARIHGSNAYSVKLWQENGDLAYSCTCPRGDDGEFCKHCVAAGLAVLAGGMRPNETQQPRRRVALKDVREYLRREDKAALVDLLMERAEWDETLRELLVLRTARSRKRRGIDVEAMKEALDEAIDPGDYLAWNEVGNHARSVEEATATIASLLVEGHAAEAVELAEHALDAIETAMGSLDDSDGHMSGVLERLQELHHDACAKARLDVAELARRLFEREISSGYDFFHGAVVTYADVLGKEGISEYRRLAAEQWAGVPAIGAGEDDPDRYGRRFRLASIMMSLARMNGDTDAQVDVLKKDLSRAYEFLKIAEVYRDAGKGDLALEWAEKGLAAFPDRTDSRLREFVAEEYHRRGRHAEAMAVMWAAFSEQPGLDEYRNLKRHADRDGEWDSWRGRAWDALREKVRTRKQAAGRTLAAMPDDHSILVEVLLWEGDVEAAWNEARAGGCVETLWMALAERRESEHPADAIPIYRRRLDMTLRHAHMDAYVEAVKLLKRIRQAMTRTGAGEEFGNYLRAIRVSHARKRNLIRLLDRANWG